ncbi:MAG: NADH:flavin oxidoreductase [Bacteroidales bacterium]|nr:NADH:flavin oxidoreductase [Bacteroidales bacterium]MBD5302846.1 NADH:flavin oxidoreductase [Bacteroides sp.]MBD5348093.1 NADH:flavin oxidoreductase [Bacteroides sp.]
MTKESKLFSPGRLGPVELRNRTIRSAAFEGMGKDNGPTEMLRDYHLSVAKGGVGMTTLAYAGICRSALSFTTQLWLRPEIVVPLREITDGIHAAGAKASIQLGHCGNMTHRSTSGGTPVGASTGFNLYSPTFCRGLRKDELKEIARYFGDAVRNARDAGFDCVEIHAGHGYLISQFLSPYTNHRRDEFGGTLANRMKFMNMCLEESLKAAGSDMAVIVKTNMRDGFKGGLEIDDCLEVAREIERAGVHGIVLSGGFVSKAPMYVMRGSMPIHSMTHYMKQWWLKYGVRMVGKYMIPSVPFEPLYFLDDARLFRKELKLPLIYVGGVIDREGADKVLDDEGFDFVQMGRALLNEPDFVNRIRRAGSENHRCGCDHVNYCIARMYSREMACHKHCADLPASIRKEIDKIKKRDGIVD